MSTVKTFDVLRYLPQEHIRKAAKPLQVFNDHIQPYLMLDIRDTIQTARIANRQIREGVRGELKGNVQVRL